MSPKNCRIFPIYCTANMPTTVIDKLLTEAQTASEHIAPGTRPSLAVMTTPATPSPPDSATRPPTRPFTPPYAGMSPQDLRQVFTAQFAGAAAHHNKTYFTVLDERTAEDESALLVALKEDGADAVETVRVVFDQVQQLLIAWEMACGSIEEVQAIASGAPGGVFGRRASTAKPPVLKGNPTPRKRLGAGT